MQNVMVFREESKASMNSQENIWYSRDKIPEEEEQEDEMEWQSRDSTPFEDQDEQAFLHIRDDLPLEESMAPADKFRECTEPQGDTEAASL